MVLLEGFLRGKKINYFGFNSSCSIITNLYPLPFLGIYFPLSLYYIGNNYTGT